MRNTQSAGVKRSYTIGNKDKYVKNPTANVKSPNSNKMSKQSTNIHIGSAGLLSSDNKLQESDKLNSETESTIVFDNKAVISVDRDSVTKKTRNLEGFNTYKTRAFDNLKIYDEKYLKKIK